MSQTAISETYFFFKTGKSCLFHQFIEKNQNDSNHTIGVEFGSKVINVCGKYVKLQIRDTSVKRSYYLGATGALLIYNISNAGMLASQNTVIILCGNKKDLDVDREVTFLEASRFAQENKLMFLETSALTGENVEEAFVQCELDPERMGSGVQYRDAVLRQLRSLQCTQAPKAQECGC
uniref:RAB4A, member RAS oncogene family n=1 Tax=Rhinopithecus roxellana TaxID=61622 RepID=A0A2K6PQ04_RHIRO